MKVSLPWSLFSIALLSLAGSAVAQSVVSPIAAEYSNPDVFRERVLSAGGAVEFVFGDDRPFAECHASSIVETKNGDLFCVWFGGTKENDPDVGIWSSVRKHGSWSTVERLVKVNETAHWNPVLFRDAEDRVHLFFKVGPEIPYWETYWMTSSDNAKSWTMPTPLVPGDKGGRGPVKNKPIVMSDGTWVAGSSTELKGWKPFIDRSKDFGVTWTRSADISIDKDVISGKGAIQPTLWESEPGYLHTLMRTTMGSVIRSDSDDGGNTWSPARVTSLPNNNSGIDAVRLADGRVALLYNPVGKNWGPRTPLTLAISEDNGESWKNVAHLETNKGEYSYPAIVATEEGLVLSYTWKRERVRCWVIPLSAL